MINLSFDLAIEFLSFLRVDVDNEPGDMQLLCLQGMSPLDGSPTKLGGGTVKLVPNTAGKYNDVIALVYRDEQDEGQVACAVGTLDPGTYYTRNPLNPLGAAHLTFGQHMYVEGLHRGWRALRAQNETNRVWRDRNGNFKPDSSDAVFVGNYGVNVHAGGRSSYIYKWSAGCINIAGGWSGEPYQYFLGLLDVHVLVKPALRVTVWRGRDLARFVDQGWDHRPTLSLGIKNQWVAEMQRLLLAKGQRLRVDGDWRTKTTEAVMSFQRKAGLKVDGWCGKKTWAALAL